MEEYIEPKVGSIGRARRSVAAVEALVRIRDERRTVAYPDERPVLAGWSGWGPLAPVFAPKDKTWDEISGRLSDLLGEADFVAGEQGTYNAFYTPPSVASAMWDLLTGLGYDGSGRVLEPGCGAGMFMAAAPAGVSMVGVERDPTTAAIAALVNPRHTVVTGSFESARIGGGFAAAIGNVPFGDVRVFDPAAPPCAKGSLHNYFIWRTVQELAPGGVAVLLTSRYTMDATDSAFRREISEDADFVGAIRLPNGGLSGGTNAIADIIVLRRKDGAERFGLDSWTSARLWRPGMGIAAYFDSLPGQVLGETVEGRTTAFGQGMRVEPRAGETVEDGVRAAAGVIIGRATERRLLWARRDITALPAADDEMQRVPAGWHEGSFRLMDDGRVLHVEKGRLKDVGAGKELRTLMALRDRVVALVQAETDHDTPDDRLTPLRGAARTAYQAYVAKYGPLNRSRVVDDKPDPDSGEMTYRRVVERLGGFRKDPDWQLVSAIEVYDDESGTAEMAPLLTARQNRRTVRPTTTDDPAEALAWSLDREGRLDLDYILRALRIDDTATVIGLLGDAIYQDPETLVWLPAEEYLSGNVRVKHAVAEAAALHRPDLARNVTALAGVLPAWLTQNQITATFGAPWIPVAYVRQFVAELLEDPWVTVERLDETNQWNVDGRRTGSVLATVDWGTQDVDAYRLMQLSLNNRTPTVFQIVDTADGGTAKVKDVDATMVAVGKMQAIESRFEAWVWEDVRRADDLCEIYNWRFNSLAARRFAGGHLTVDGLAPWFSPYPHQREMVARVLGSRASLCGHEVGAGKTATMAMTAMKARQSGIARKPMIVVPKHLREQTVAEFSRLFPGAKILSMAPESIAANRRSFAARCATEEWDMVVVTHTTFDGIPVSEETEVAYMRQQVDRLRAAIAARESGGGKENRVVKQAKKRLDNLRTRMAELRHKARGRDIGVTWEMLGIDMLMLDEAHYYKNLALPVMTEGFTVRPSKRATDLDVKLHYLRHQRPDGPYAALFTGTPVSNTMLECYVVLHYLMPEYLEEIGLGSPDAWASAFVKFATKIEVTVDGGGFQMRTRPQDFVNAPELWLLLSQVADIRNAEQLGLKRPAVDEQIVAVQPTRVQAEYSADLVVRSERVRSQGVFGDKKDDNMLKICGDGRRMATDPALVGLADREPGKIAAVVDRILADWREHPDELQMGFCDVGTPQGEDRQTYGRIIDGLVAGGMPRNRIRTIHEAPAGPQKAALFQACRSGEVTVILGSTDKLGVGTNVQHRGISLHHIDAPFRPADIAQRDGRFVRPGNRNPVVKVYRYVTQRTFDAYMWQMLLRKASFIAQLMSGNLDRVIGDIESDTITSFSAIMATATDQPLLIEKTRLAAEVKRLEGDRRNHRSNQQRMRLRIEHLERRIERDTATMDMWRQIRERYTGAELGEDDGERLVELLKEHRTPWVQADVRFAGVRVSFDRKASHTGTGIPRPIMQVHAGTDRHSPSVKVNVRVSTSAWELTDLLRAELTTSLTEPEILARLNDEARAEIAECAAVEAREFDQQAELDAAQAALRQINADLHTAAESAEAAIVVDRTAAAEPVITQITAPVITPEPETPAEPALTEPALTEPAVVEPETPAPADDDVDTMFAEIIGGLGMTEPTPAAAGADEDTDAMFADILADLAAA